MCTAVCNLHVFAVVQICGVLRSEADVCERVSWFVAVRDLAIWDVLVAYVPVSGLSMSGEWLHVVSAASVFPMFGLLNEAVVQH